MFSRRCARTWRYHGLFACSHYQNGGRCIEKDQAKERKLRASLVCASLFLILRAYLRDLWSGKCLRRCWDLGAPSRITDPAKKSKDLTIRV